MLSSSMWWTCCSILSTNVEGGRRFLSALYHLAIANEFCERGQVGVGAEAIEILASRLPDAIRATLTRHS